MALSLSQTVALGNVLKPGMRVASMGYPDIIAPVEMLVDNFPRFGESIVNYRGDSEEICKRHGLQKRLIPDAESFFSLMECKLDVYDIVRERGCEILCDLNEKWGRNGQFDPRGETYDIVLDVGTIEHCFNIAQAAKNMAGLVKVGGYIIHENPFCAGNHGFYGMNPTWYADFYSANGFELIACHLTTRDGHTMQVPLTKRFIPQLGESNVFAMARRTVIKPMEYPCQSKYANAAPAAGVDRAKEIVNG